MKKLKFLWFLITEGIFITTPYNKECDEWVTKQIKNTNISVEIGHRYDNLFFNSKGIRIYAGLKRFQFEGLGVRPSLWNTFLIIEEFLKYEECEKEKFRQEKYNRIKLEFKI